MGFPLSLSRNDFVYCMSHCCFGTPSSTC